jgi:crossover junction endodeoxyribonuclease RuvC
MSIILGIDPGLSSTGYGIIQVKSNKYIHLTDGVIKTSSKDNTGTRLGRIYHCLTELIKEFKPDEAGVEKIFFANNAKTALPVAEAKGVILYCLAHNHIHCCEYTPLEVKQALIGRGKADKYQVKQMVKMLFRLANPPKEEHAADALAIALCHFHHSTSKY